MQYITNNYQFGINAIPQCSFQQYVVSQINTHNEFGYSLITHYKLIICIFLAYMS